MGNNKYANYIPPDPPERTSAIIRGELVIAIDNLYYNIGTPEKIYRLFEEYEATLLKEKTIYVDREYWDDFLKIKKC